MQFTLTYTGPLSSRQRGGDLSKEKAAIRSHLHPQIREQVLPYMSAVGKYLQRGEDFVCLVVDLLKLRAELDVLLMVPTSSKSGGDIDNRTKTLLDGLTMPKSQQLEAHVAPPGGEPMFCLLEDDSLVDRLSVDRRRWLGRAPGDNEIMALISFQLTQSAPTYGGQSLGAR